MIDTRPQRHREHRKKPCGEWEVTECLGGITVLSEWFCVLHIREATSVSSKIIASENFVKLCTFLNFQC